MNQASDIQIREYRNTDRKSVIKLFEDFQDYLVVLDPLKRLRRLPEYGPRAAQKMCERISAEHGKILVVEHNRVIIGFGACVIEEQSAFSLLERLPSKSGHIVELYVIDEYRGKGIGKRLLEEMEKYLQSENCNAILIEVFAPNKDAKRFYENVGYRDRSAEVMKVLSK